MSLTLERPATTSGLEFQPTTALIGADVTGIDLRQELDQETVRRLREALLTYKVLFFRDQLIDDVEQIRFTRYFGDVTPAHPVTNGLPELPEIKVNTLHGGPQEYRSFRLDAEHPLRPVSRSRSGRGWHIDITFVANPAAITVLRGVEIPSHGGDTAWVDLEALYAGLSAPLQRLVDDCRRSMCVTTPRTATRPLRASMAARRARSPPSIHWCVCIRRLARSHCSSAPASSRQSTACIQARARLCSTTSTRNSVGTSTTRCASAGRQTQLQSGIIAPRAILARSTAHM